MHTQDISQRRCACQGCRHGLFPMLFGSVWSHSYRNRPGTRTNLICRKKGGGRKPLDYRKVFEGIVYVLRTGCQWKALPKEIYGSPSSVHAYFRQWEKAGVFLTMWRAGLAEYDEMEGISWLWQSIDSAMTKAPLAREAVGPSPTDRGKKRKQTPFAGGRAWRPAVDHRHRGE